MSQANKKTENEKAVLKCMTCEKEFTDGAGAEKHVQETGHKKFQLLGGAKRWR